ncbi:hypothetical protein Prum_100010 [Phytohabitans rumicis]|uniref:Response regulatory domain-containing protein n=1 Tax=Phytohabitans rumicis TaxID=1076125 RepID=A0A6V8LNY4_9ACTN|nr:hypothetical protein Prum_100010 [Phytohabitans rumicis]
MVNRMARILLVEDDRIIVAALTRALVDAGHVVRATAQAADALRIVTEDRPDLVILDLGLPDIDGADALRMMRGVSDVPVIVATARRSEVDIINLLNAGADDYVTKPFSGGTCWPGSPRCSGAGGARPRRCRASRSAPS